MRQQRSLPHMPVISLGVSEMPCSFAILMEIGEKSVRNWEQQRVSIPHAPIPPRSFATSRGPICRISTCVFGYRLSISFLSDLRSTFSSLSVLKRKARRGTSQLYSDVTILSSFRSSHDA